MAGTNRRAFSVEQCSKMLGLGLTTTHVAVRSGQILGIKICGRWLIPAAALERLLEGAESHNGETQALNAAVRLVVPSNM